MKLKTNWHFTKWDGLNILFVVQCIWCFKNLWGSANILLQITLKVGKNEDFDSTIFFEAQKYYFVFESRPDLFSKWWYSQSCFDVAQRCENRRWKWESCLDIAQHYLIQLWNTQRCFNVVERCKFQHWPTQRCFNIDLTLCDVGTSYQPKNNVEPTLNVYWGSSFQFIQSDAVSKRKSLDILYRIGTNRSTCGLVVFIGMNTYILYIRQESQNIFESKVCSSFAQLLRIY